MKIRKLLRTLHRDLGYFIVGITFIYTLSGIYLNHRHDFNPNYRITVTEFKHNLAVKSSYSDDEVREVVEAVGDEITYKKHYIDQDGDIKVFIANGEVILNPENGEGTMRYLHRRPVIFSFNQLHKSGAGATWKWVSDVMAVILMFVAISGLFLLKGKRGFVRWGWWLTIAGFAVPLLFIVFFM